MNKLTAEIKRLQKNLSWRDEERTIRLDEAIKIISIFKEILDENRVDINPYLDTTRENCTYDVNKNKKGSWIDVDDLMKQLDEALEEK